MARVRVVSALLTGLVVVAGSTVARAQSPVPDGGGLRFEVASVKPGMSPAEMGRAAAASAAAGGGFSIPNLGIRVQPGGRLVGTASLQTLILRAYGIRAYQIEGGPKWLTTDYFDIAAKAGRDTATETEMNEMLKSLLAERFGLRVHVETREATVHTLTVARADGRLGPALKRTSAECEKELEERKRTGASAPPAPRPSGPQPRLVPICGMTSTMVTRAGSETYAMRGRPLSDLVDRISGALKAPVNDQSGLSGLFDLVLEFESTRRFAGPAPAGPDLNSTDPLPVPLPAALQQQLGLKLEKSTGPLSVTIVDAAEQPSPN
jgi:uncharacterized protein (TIGR03435 family)